MEENTSNKRTLIQNLIPTIPIIGSFLIFLGVLRLVIFYAHFGIEIVNFLEFTEILTSFLDILAITILVMILSIIQSLFLEDKKTQEKKDKLRDQIFKERSFLKRLLKYCKLSMDFFIISIILTILNFIVYYYQEKNLEALFYLPLIILSLPTLLLLFYEFEIKIRKQSETGKKNYRLIYFGSLISLATIGQGKYQAHNIEHGGAHIGYQVILEDDTKLVSDHQNYYVGKTNGYLFFYHEIERKTDIIPITRVKEIQVTKTKNK